MTCLSLCPPVAVQDHHSENDKSVFGEIGFLESVRRGRNPLSHDAV